MDQIAKFVNTKKYQSYPVHPSRDRLTITPPILQKLLDEGGTITDLAPYGAILMAVNKLTAQAEETLSL
jgi:hypothetical protein